MRANYLEKLKKAPWTFRQILTKRPAAVGAPVSDLFVWRNSDEWQTSFELMDMAGLFADEEPMPDRYVTLFFFDNQGAFFLEQRVDLVENRRITLDLTPWTALSASAYGTFCVFHSHTPRMVTDLGSHLAERGYLSYRYRGAPLQAYGHGNLDAIALLENKQLQLLGSRSFLEREYRLQHQLLGPALYEVGLVNSSATKQDISCLLLSSNGGEVVEKWSAQVKPNGCHVFPIRLEQSQSGRVVIQSHLIMARPLVFRIFDNKVDVFHG